MTDFSKLSETISSLSLPHPHEFLSACLLVLFSYNINPLIFISKVNPGNRRNVLSYKRIPPMRNTVPKNKKIISDGYIPFPMQTLLGYVGFIYTIYCFPGWNFLCSFDAEHVSMLLPVKVCPL